MVTKMSATPFAFVGIIAAVMIVLCFTVAICSAPNWEFNVNTLSDLGISEDGFTASLFNWTCIIGGILMIIFGVGKALVKKDLDMVSAIFVAVAGLFLINVGIFTKGDNMHLFMAYTFFTLCIIGMFISGISDWNHGRKLTTSVTVIVFVVFLASLPGFAVPGIEVIGVFGSCLWLAAQGLSLAFSKD